ncbi:hypothetical protein GCM10028822_42780 [Hymenobacter terrigena]
MQRITKLTLKNFKGFRYQEFPIERRHTLIFGNNGAGKSSVYWALHALLHSTTKPAPVVAKYFAFPDQYNPATNECLRNVFAPATDEAYVEMAYCAPGQTAHTDRIEATGTTTEKDKNADLYAAFLASDFVHYRFLQDVFANTNRHGIDLWPVFERDIFPYFSPDGTGSEVLGDVWKELFAGPPKGPGGQRTVKVGTRQMQAYEQRLNTFNSTLAVFMSSVTEKANKFLKQRFFDGNEDTIKFRISVSYQALITREELQRGILRHNRLPLLVERPDPARKGEWLPVPRPQAFLNEAQLTRIALALRLGALDTRPSLANFRLLCLDDLLISLDMVNRQHVLEWLFDKQSAITTNYQIFFFTHDRELFKMVRHYATTRQADEWNIFELLVNDDLPPHEREPHLLTDYADFYEQAQRHYNNGEYAACANYLRKEAEHVMKQFLSPAQLYVEPRENGDPGFKNLGDLLGEMQQTFNDHNVEMGKLRDLKWTLSSVLNSMSHDSYGTQTYQSELRQLLFGIFPELRELKSSVLVAVKEPQGSFVKFVETDAIGVEHIYTVRLYESLREIVFPGGIRKASFPKCRLQKHEARGFEVVLLPSEAKFTKECPSTLRQIQTLVRKQLHGPLQASELLAALRLTA